MAEIAYAVANESVNLTRQNNSTIGYEREALPLEYDINGPLLMTIFVAGTFLNLFALLYFLLKERKTSATIQYLFISGTDLIICFLCLFHAIEAVSLPDNFLFFEKYTVRGYYPVLCNVVGLLWNVLSRLSVYLIAVLTVSQVASLYFHKDQKKTVLLVILGYLLILVVQECLQLRYNEWYWPYHPFLPDCTWLVRELYISILWQKIVYAIIDFTEMTVIAIPIVLCVVLIVVWLCGSGKCGADLVGMREKRDGAVTVVVLAVVYILCHVPYWIISTAYVLVMHLKVSSELVDVLVNSKVMTMLGFVHFIALNSLINGIVYFARYKGLRRFVGLGKRA